MDNFDIKQQFALKHGFDTFHELVITKGFGIWLNSNEQLQCV